MSQLTQEKMQEMFYYENGSLFYREDGKHGKKKGNKAEYPHSAGYLAVSINGRTTMAHRVIWMYHHGYLPKMIDHIDGNKLNNDIKNLRIANASQNQHNRRINKDNKTGVKGMCIQKVKLNNKVYIYYRASIYRDNVPIVKLFKDKLSAIKFLQKTRVDLHGSFARFK